MRRQYQQVNSSFDQTHYIHHQIGLRDHQTSVVFSGQHTFRHRKGVRFIHPFMAVVCERHDRPLYPWPALEGLAMDMDHTSDILIFLDKFNRPFDSMLRAITAIELIHRSHRSTKPFRLNKVSPGPTFTFTTTRSAVHTHLRRTTVET